MLMGRKIQDDGYHGNDGFGDVPDPNPPDNNIVNKKHGVQALLDISKTYQGQMLENDALLSSFNL